MSSTTHLVSLDATSLTSDERHALGQYGKLVKFRDEVLSGAHPRIQPAGLAGLKSGTDDSYSPLSTNSLNSNPSASPKAKATSSKGDAQASETAGSYKATPNSHRTSMNRTGTLPGLGMLGSIKVNGTPKAVAAGKPEINPVLLEKSDDLIKAEIQIQRQRLERSLKEQADQKKAATKTTQHAQESLTELDLADVLTRALALVQSTAVPVTDAAAANGSTASDSFDDNTFYSSRHDTPETPQISRVPEEPEDPQDEQMREDSYEPQLDTPPVIPAVTAQPSFPTRDPPSHPYLAGFPSATQPPGIGAPAYIPGVLNNRVESLQVGAAVEVISSDESGAASRSGDSGRITERPSDLGNLYSLDQQLLNRTRDRRDSPVVRAHNLSPVAPQPEHVSPLAISRQPPLTQADASARQATPAQVAALRKAASVGTSPESSPQGSKSEKRKKKKKKRKAERLAAESAAASPYIKPEPRSPSPVTAPPYSRPNKRQRPNNPQQPALDYDEPRYAQPPTVDGAQHPEYGYRNDGPEVIRLDSDAYPPPRMVVQPSVAGEQRFEGGYYADRRGPSEQASYSAAHDRETRAVREIPSYPLDISHHETPRTSMRTEAIRERSRSPIRYERPPATMPPPRAATRIVVDEYGREYREPLSSSVQPENAGIRYERAPARPVSQHPELFEQDGVVYRRVSPGLAPPPRRVFTQPEAVAPEYRVLRDHDYLARPMAHPTDDHAANRGRVVTEGTRDFLSRPTSVRPPEGVRYETTVGYERRQVDEPLRDYMTSRAASLRPPESSRYEIPMGYERRILDDPVREYGSLRAASVRPVGYEVVRDYGARFGSVRPEVPHREYATSVHQEARREMAPIQPPARSYSVRPFEGLPPTPVTRQEYNVRHPDPYHVRPLQGQDDEVIYIERPPPSSYH